MIEAICCRKPKIAKPHVITTLLSIPLHPYRAETAHYPQPSRTAARLLLFFSPFHHIVPNTVSDKITRENGKNGGKPILQNAVLSLEKQGAVWYNMYII